MPAPEIVYNNVFPSQGNSLFVLYYPMRQMVVTEKVFFKNIICT